MYHIGWWFLSYLLKFCEWHRILIYADVVVLIAVDLYSKGIKIPYVFYVLGGFLLLSLVISSILYFKYGQCSKKDHNKTIQKNNLCD